MAIEDGYAFVSPGSPEVARALLEAADKAGLDSWVVRTTIGGFYVPEAVAKRYEKFLGAKEEDAPAPEEVVDEAPAAPDESWKVADIRQWAEDNEVDLGGATKKADLLAAVASADKE